jgi:hypothetical protein
VIRVTPEWPERTEVWRLRPDTNVWTKLAHGDWLFAKALFEGGVRSWKNPRLLCEVICVGEDRSARTMNSVFHVPPLPEHLRRFT